MITNGAYEHELRPKSRPGVDILVTVQVLLGVAA